MVYTNVSSSDEQRSRVAFLHLTYIGAPVAQLLRHGAYTYHLVMMTAWLEPVNGTTTYRHVSMPSERTQFLRSISEC